MPSLLTPAFLAGLLAIAVPILVHLRMRERKTSVPFPSLMFVRKIPHKSFRRRTLQNLFLFAARTLAVILLCFAFARPFFPVSAKAGDALAGPRGRVIALDVSGSMQYEGVFARAQAEAERAVSELDTADAVGVLLFSDQVQGVAPPSTDHAKALAAIRSAKAESRSTRFAPALRLAGDWLSALKADRREIVLITDGQTRALTGAADVGLPTGTTIIARSVAPEQPDNAAIAEVTVEHVRETDRGFGIVNARLMHQGEGAREVKAGLEVAGRLIEEKTISLPPSGAVNVTFTRAPLPAGVSQARVTLSGDRLKADDVFHFVVGASGDIRVLLIDNSPFVARALEIGDQPSFDVLRRTSLAPADLANRSLVIFGDSLAGAVSPAASAALAQFVQKGGGLLATTPLVGLRGDAAQLLPASWGENVSRMADRGASLGFVDLDHPALFAFKQARGSDFSRARFLQYRTLKTNPDAKGAPLKVLARFDDGREALVETSFGEGRVVAFTSPVNGVMSDLPVQPLFLPLIHELARYASAHQDTPLSHRIGSAVDFREKDSVSAADPIAFVIAPSGRKQKLEDGVTGIEVEEPGFYEAQRASGARSVVASNMDVAESDLSALDQDELQAALRSPGATREQTLATTPIDAAARQSWWRLTLLALVLLMVAETVAANTRGRKVTS